MIIAGEASGDNHGAEVVKALKQHQPTIQFSGMAGPAMRAAGVEALINAEDMAIMGFVEVLANLKIIYQSYYKIKRELLTNRPDLIILIDYPGFNLKIAALAKSLGIKVLYYVSPQIWAWKKGRIKKIKAYVNMMAVIFPFEVDIYKKAGVPVEYVGSPLAETVHCELSLIDARKKLDLDLDKTIIALLPGSRKIEIKRLLPVMLEAANRLNDIYKNKIQFVLPVASTLNKQEIEFYLQSVSANIKLIQGDTYTAIRASDIALCTSGTVTLETALLNTPMVLIYKMQPISYYIIKRLIKIKMIGLCNIVAERPVVPELIQEHASVDNIVNALQNLIENTKARHLQTTAFAEIKQKLAGDGAAENVARLALNLLDNPSVI